MKLKITIDSGTLTGQQFELTDGSLTIGRTENCNIKFDPFTEKIASKQHAFIESKADGFYITDNNSTNGTIVNGQKVQTQKLNSSDKIQFGKAGVLASVLIDDYKNEEISPTFAGFPNQQSSQTQQETAKIFDQNLLVNINQPFQNQPITVLESVTSIGIKNFDTAPEESKTGKYVGIAITLFTLVFLGLIVTGIMLLSLGVVPALIAAFVAFIPAMLYISPIVWLDRYDPEPAWLLALSFSWGALVAVILSIIINTAVGKGIASIASDPQTGQVLGFISSTVFSAPIFEEITKGAGLLVIVLFFRKYFDGILDGIIFAGIIALGFSTVENVLYYGREFAGKGFEGLFGIFIARGVFTPFAHVTFTAMTGIGFGIARESHKTFVRFALPIIGLLGAIALHMFWNGSMVASAILFQDAAGIAIILIYLIIEIPFFLIFVGFSFWIMWRQNRIIREMLAIDVAQGTIPTEHFEKATSAFKSTAWLIGSIFKGKYKATSSYIRAIGKLGLSYWHIQRAEAAQGETVSLQQNPILRNEVLKWRDKV